MASHGAPRSSVTEPRTEEARQKELHKIEEYQKLVESVEGKKIRNHDYTPETLQLTSRLLKKNPEYYTIWNHRRRILEHHFSVPIKQEADSADDRANDDIKSNNQDAATTATEREADISTVLAAELRFLFPLLLEFPKCYWIWNYRLWTLSQADARLPRASARRFWQDELGLVAKMLARDGRNFHGWGYRRTIVAALERERVDVNGNGKGGGDGEGQGEGQGRGGQESMAKAELAYTTKMIGSNLSNFSAWHNRSKLIPRVLRETDATDEERVKMLDEELNLIHEALIDPSDQSLWFYHACLVAAFTPSQAPESIAPSLPTAQRVKYLEAEIAYVLEILDDGGAEGCKWVYQSLVQLCRLVREQTGQWPATVAQADVKAWMARLRELDALRGARWAALERELEL